MYAGPLFKNISRSLTKECLNCIICYEGRLAKTLILHSVCLRLNRAAAFENVTLGCRALSLREHRCIYGSSVFIPWACHRLKYMTCPAAGRCPGTLTVAKAWMETKTRKELIKPRVIIWAVSRRTTRATGLVTSWCENRLWQMSWASNTMGMISA